LVYYHTNDVNSVVFVFRESRECPDSSSYLSIYFGNELFDALYWIFRRDWNNKSYDGYDGRIYTVYIDVWHYFCQIRETEIQSFELRVIYDFHYDMVAVRDCIYVGSTEQEYCNEYSRQYFQVFRWINLVGLFCENNYCIKKGFLLIKIF